MPAALSHSQRAFAVYYSILPCTFHGCELHPVGGHGYIANISITSSWCIGWSLSQYVACVGFRSCILLCRHSEQPDTGCVLLIHPSTVTSIWWWLSLLVMLVVSGARLLALNVSSIDFVGRLTVLGSFGLTHFIKFTSYTQVCHVWLSVWCLLGSRIWWRRIPFAQNSSVILMSVVLTRVRFLKNLQMWTGRIYCNKKLRHSGAPCRCNTGFKHKMAYVRTVLNKIVLGIGYALPLHHVCSHFEALISRFVSTEWTTPIFPVVHVHPDIPLRIDACNSSIQWHADLRLDAKPLYWW